MTALVSSGSPSSELADLTGSRGPQTLQLASEVRVVLRIVPGEITSLVM